MKDNNILKVNNLKTHFTVDKKVIPAVDGISFELKKGETLAVVGESGSGKSVTALSIMRLIQSPPGKIVDGEIFFDDKDLVKLSEKEMRKIRGNRISMIFQEPMTSLNPVYRVGEQISEVLRLHQKMDKKMALKKTIELLKLIGIPSPEKRVYDYPHQLSGGMRQRIMIAMALSCNPDLLIADEPTTALDVTIQAQILDLIKELKEKLDMSVLFITHDLGVVAETANKVIVMYAGNVMEQGNVREIFHDPLHPYTKGLLKSIPKLDTTDEKLYTIKGMVPHLSELPEGCVFSTRCDECMDICKKKRPKLLDTKDGRKVSCWLYREEDK